MWFDIIKITPEELQLVRQTPVWEKEIDSLKEPYPDLTWGGEGNLMGFYIVDDLYYLVATIDYEKLELFEENDYKDVKYMLDEYNRVGFTNAEALSPEDNLKRTYPDEHHNMAYNLKEHKLLPSYAVSSRMNSKLPKSNSKQVVDTIVNFIEKIQQIKTPIAFQIGEVVVDGSNAILYRPKHDIGTLDWHTYEGESLNEIQENIEKYSQPEERAQTLVNNIIQSSSAIKLLSPEEVEQWDLTGLAQDSSKWVKVIGNTDKEYFIHLEEPAHAPEYVGGPCRVRMLDENWQHYCTNTDIDNKKPWSDFIASLLLITMNDDSFEFGERVIELD